MCTEQVLHDGHSSEYLRRDTQLHLEITPFVLWLKFHSSVIGNTQFGGVKYVWLIEQP